jgi:hypothetical protein
MATLRGTVVKSNSGPKPYTCLNADGTFLGNFVSQREAEIPIERLMNRRLRWTLTVLPSGVETYRGEDM